MFVLLLITIALIANVSAGSVGDKIKEIFTGASSTCTNKYFSSPYLKQILCDNLVPQKYIDKIGINLQFGANTTWCAGLACTYRLMGCAEQTYDIEAEIIKATGKAEDCGTNVGLDDEDCATFAKFVAKAPAASKRSEPERLTVESLTADQREEALASAVVAMEQFFGEELKDNFDEIHAMFPEARKRDTGNAILEQLQVCSELIGLGLQLIEGAINLPVNVSDHLGPCGTICNVGLCALNVMCASHAEPLLKRVNALRSGLCDELHCAKFIKAPPSVCQEQTCDVEIGHYNTDNCPPPKTIHQPSKTTIDDCCEKCEDLCAGQQCPELTCPEPELPLCASVIPAKNDPYACCPQCLSTCPGEKIAQCPPAPTEAECQQKGLVLAPSRPGDCCLSCQPGKCAGMDCRNAPQTAQECAAQGLVLIQANLESPNSCVECCNRCGQGAAPQTDKPNLIEGSASTMTLALFAVLAAIATLF